MQTEDSQVTKDWLNNVKWEPLWTNTERKQEITDAYNEEQAHPTTPKAFDDIPLSYDSISSEWLTAVLGKDVPEAKVESFMLGPPDEGTSNRRHITLKWNQAGQTAKLPESCFCKATQDLVNRITLSYGAIESEVNFYTLVRPKIDMEAPEAIHCNMNNKSYNSIIILKDLSGKVQFLNCKHNPSKKQMEEKIKTLAKLHATFWESREPFFKKFVHFATGLRGHIASGGVEGANEYGWKEAKSVCPPDMFPRWQETWLGMLIALQRNYEDLPQTLAHSDLHPGNWYLTNEGKLGLQDYQCIARGTYARDVAYLLATSTNVETRRTWEKDLMCLYLSELHKNGGPQIAEEEAWLETRLQLFNVLTFWAHTLTPSADMPAMQPYDISLETMKRILHMMDDCDSLGAAHHFAPQYNIAMPSAP